VAKSFVSHGTIIVSAYLAPQEPLHRVVWRALVVHLELVNLHPLFVFKELEGILSLALTLCCRESSPRPLGRSDLLRLAYRQGYALLVVLGYHHRRILCFPGLMGLDHWQDQCSDVVNALQQTGIITPNYQRLVIVGHL
jgi:hypothetical protein